MSNSRLLTLALLLTCAATAYSRTSAVVEFSRTELTVTDERSLTIKEFRRVRIIDESGYQHAIFYDYLNKFRKIKKVQYTIFDAANRKIKRLTKADAINIAPNASYEIADARLLIIDPEYRNYPFVIEVETEVEYNGFLDFPRWMPRDQFDLEVKKSELVFNFLNGYDFRVMSRNGVKEPVKTTNGKTSTLSWTISDLKAVDRYLSYKMFAAHQPAVYITPTTFQLDNTTGTYNSWTAFGQWYHELNKGRNEISENTKSFLNQLRSRHEGDIKAICDEVYQYMQSKTRYISIQLGIGGFQTIPSDEVEQNGYGDCKALTNYMKSMLDYLKIPSNNVLVFAGTDVPDIFAAFPSNQFNHVFLAVPMAKDTLWYECTSQLMPPAFAGTFTDDRHVLWVKDQGSKVVRTPEISASASTKKINTTVEIQKNGDAAIRINTTQSGMFYDEAMRYQYSTKDRITKYNNDKFDFHDFSIKDFTFALPSKKEPILNVNFHVAVNSFATPIGTKLSVPLTFLDPIDKALGIDAFNKICDVRRPFTITDEAEVVLPENTRALIKPVGLKEHSNFADYELRVEEVGDGKLRVTRKISLRKGTYEGQQFDSFQEVIKRIKTAEREKIVFQSKT